MKLILAVLLILASAVPPKAQVRQSHPTDDEKRIRAFLKRSGHGLPFREARELQREKRAVSILLQIIQSKRETDIELRIAAIVLLGIIGDQAVIEPLMGLMRKGPDLDSQLDRRDYHALVYIPMALGYTLAEINRQRKRSQKLEKARAEILDYLLQGVQPAFWQEHARRSMHDGRARSMMTRISGTLCWLGKRS